MQFTSQRALPKIQVVRYIVNFMFQIISYIYIKKTYFICSIRNVRDSDDDVIIIVLHFINSSIHAVENVLGPQKPHLSGKTR